LCVTLVICQESLHDARSTKYKIVLGILWFLALSLADPFHSILLLYSLPVSLRFRFSKPLCTSATHFLFSDLAFNRSCASKHFSHSFLILRLGFQSVMRFEFSNPSFLLLNCLLLLLHSHLLCAKIKHYTYIWWS